MPRLFKKFFVIIWLTLAASLGAIMLIVYLFQSSPFAPKLERQKREVVLDLTQGLLISEGEVAARRFALTSEAALPLGLTISRATAPAACSSAASENARSVLDDDICYEISVSPVTGYIPEKLAPFLLWIGILIASAVSAVALARYLIGPVEHLREGLSALAHGRFDVRIGDKMSARRDEVSALAHDFDTTAARLQELQDAQQALFHDVSHELRSPLSRLQAVAGVLRQSPAKLDSMLDRMDREVERLDTLVGEVLTLARLKTATSLPLNTQTLDVVDLLNEILGDAAFEAEARQVSITKSVEGAFLADVEGELIYRALENVIRNAVKYSSARSRIYVVCDISDQRLEVCVIDQGPGVGGDELERIFQPFARGTDAEPRGGYGLGLAIARQAIERHGGRVFASLPQAGGLAITLEIPRRLVSHRS